MSHLTSLSAVGEKSKRPIEPSRQTTFVAGHKLLRVTHCSLLFSSKPSQWQVRTHTLPDVVPGSQVQKYWKQGRRETSSQIPKELSLPSVTLLFSLWEAFLCLLSPCDQINVRLLTVMGNPNFPQACQFTPRSRLERWAGRKNRHVACSSSQETAVLLHNSMFKLVYIRCASEGNSQQGIW